MSTRIVDQVDSWDDRSFSGGYRQLQTLADEDFSGVVRAGGAELYMTRGVVVGIQRGDVEDFQSSGTVYEAPTDALPLLAIMQVRSDEVRAKYYTEDTSISKVDKTLSDGGFTGYIELSENVLSGDYYLVYHAGTSMSVAYVGESSRLIEGDEAFETADGEVGIYEVRPVDIEPIEIPEPEDDESNAAAPDAAAADTNQAQSETPSDASQPTAETTADAAEPTADETDTSSESTNDTTTETASSTADTTETPGTATPSETADTTETTTNTAGATDSSDSSAQSRNTQSEQRETTPTEVSEGDDTTRSQGRTNAAQTERRAEPRETAERSQQAGERTTETTERRQSRTAAETTERSSEPRGQTQPTQTDRRTSERTHNGTDQPRVQSTQSQRRTQEAHAEPQPATQDVELNAIPSLDPDQTAVPDDVGDAADPIPSPSEGSSQPSESPPPQDGRTAGQQAAAEPTTAEPAQSTQSNGVDEPHPSNDPPRTERPEPAGTATPPAEPDRPTEPREPAEPEPAIDSEELEELETELAEKDEEIDDLEAELASVTEERDDLETELEDLRSERDDLQEEVAELQDDLRRLEEELGAATDAEQRLTAGEALAGTDIFVRYRSKGKATLEKAHGGSTRKEDVNENLRLEKHTQFDADTVAVGGQSYEEFLESTLEYQFVRWAVRELLFEIRDTGHEKALNDLYNVLPRVDRAELSGVVDVTYTEDGQQTQSQESFDVVLRDRMGNPLLAANLNDTREATTESMMERLITSAERVGQSSDGFSGAFLVTESFFDPGALEIASDATQGGLLSRDKRKSFVNLSRKRGYHLCLVEARNENFHLAVPEL